MGCTGGDDPTHPRQHRVTMAPVDLWMCRVAPPSGVRTVSRHVASRAISAIASTTRTAALLKSPTSVRSSSTGIVPPVRAGTGSDQVPGRGGRLAGPAAPGRGGAGELGQPLFFFSGSDYTATASEYADATGMALFTYRPDGSMAPATAAGRHVMRVSPSPQFVAAPAPARAAAPARVAVPVREPADWTERWKAGGW